MDSPPLGEWQVPDQVPTLVQGCSLGLRQMIKASVDFARKWGATASITESLPEPRDPIPGDGMAVNLLSATLNMGGAERHTVELACALKRLGYDAVVAVQDMWSPHRPHVDRLRSHGIPIETLNAIRPAPVTIWWGTCMEGKHPAGSIYVAHSASRLVLAAVERASGDIDRIVGVSRMATAVAAQAADVPATTIWNGVIGARDTAMRDGPGYVLGYLGRYDTEKGVALAIASLAHTQEDVRLRCYGRGPHKGALAHAADDHGVGDRVDICGVADDFESVAGEFDALIVPDLVQGFPMTVCEALMNGTPVVAVNLGDLEYVLADGRGVVVEPSARSLASGVDELRSRTSIPDPGWALDHLSADVMAAAYTHAIHGVFNG